MKEWAAGRRGPTFPKAPAGFDGDRRDGDGGDNIDSGMTRG